MTDQTPENGEREPTPDEVHAHEQMHRLEDVRAHRDHLRQHIGMALASVMPEDMSPVAIAESVLEVDFEVSDLIDDFEAAVIQVAYADVERAVARMQAEREAHREALVDAYNRGHSDGNGGKRRSRRRALNDDA